MLLVCIGWWGEVGGREEFHRPAIPLLRIGGMEGGSGTGAARGTHAAREVAVLGGDLSGSSADSHRHSVSGQASTYYWTLGSVQQQPATASNSQQQPIMVNHSQSRPALAIVRIDWYVLVAGPSVLRMRSTALPHHLTYALETPYTPTQRYVGV